MIGRLVAGVIVVGLAIGVWALWPRGETDTTPATSVVAVATTTTSTTKAVTTTVVETSTTSTLPRSHVVTTVEETEEILRDLWFGWFEGIHNQDEDRIREVVASQSFLDAGLDQFGVMEFQSEPTPEGIVFLVVEILLSNEECFVTWSESDANEFLGPGPTREGVDVQRWMDNEWRLASSWVNRGDLWEADCVSQLDPLS